MSNAQGLPGGWTLLDLTHDTLQRKSLLKVNGNRFSGLCQRLHGFLLLHQNSSSFVARRRLYFSNNEAPERNKIGI